MDHFGHRKEQTIGRRLARYATLACVVSVMVSSSAFASGPIAPGDDLWVTPAGGSYDNNPIPADFFDPGSDPFTGGISLQGLPLNNDQPGLFPIDTIVRRPVPTSPGFACGSPPETIPVEIVALSLVSSAPITVTYNGGANPEQWDVQVCLDGAQQQGSMTVGHECDIGGTYQVSIPINVQLTFTRQSDLAQRTLSSSIVMNSDGYWTHQDPFGGALYTINPGTQFDSDCDGVLDNSSIGSTPPPNGFFPGMWLTGCSACGAPVTASKKPLNSEQALLAAHGVFPANGDKPPFVSTEACTISSPTGTQCLDVEVSHCSQRGGTPGGPGSQCQPPPQQYENWVIADDFKVSCPKCQCDFDFDGVCSLNDLAFILDCINNGGGPNCDQADLDCDGVVGSGDTAIWQCLFDGNPASDCCVNARPKITRVRWYGSYFDPEFEPPANTRDIDAWLIALHSDVPPQACPPVPPGTKPIDLCGTLDQCATGDWLFTPKGSSFTYNLADVNSLLSGANIGDMVRICGHFDDLISGPCTSGIDTAVVNAVLPCDSKVSKPSRLLAQWSVDPANVTIQDTGKVGWDGHRIYCYEADLPEGCLLHNFSTAGEVDATKRICPLNNRTYWMSIQAAEGHAFTMNADGSCTEIDTGDPPVTQDFWGWHTTPPGYQRLDDAYMGSLHMAVDPNDPTGCERSWVYNWMSHLHCSDPKYKDCCDDPTKSIDMAFCLFDIGRRCGNGDPCVIDTDCSDGSTCQTIELARWCQPINPGPPAPPLPPIPPLPPANPDEMKETVADAVISLDGFPPNEPVIGMVGPTVIKRGIEHEDIGAPRDIIDTEIIAMDLVGSSPTLGPVRLGLNPNNPSSGQSARNHGQYQIDSFFDIWPEITVGTQVLITPVPVRVQALHFEIPPGRVSFDGPTDGIPVPLIDRDSGDQVGTLDQISHFVPYNGGVNIHSDVDWPSSPMDDCCEPNAAATACEPVVCPDPTQTCVPTEQDCQCVFGCTSTGDPCFSDADCPIAGDTCDAMGCTCTVLDCECRNPDPPCQAVEVPGAFPPIECVNDCEDPALECRRFGLDTDGDGIDDYWRCDCDPVDDPTGVCCDQNGNCFVTTASQCPVPPNISFHPGGGCLGTVACCLPSGVCSNIDALCCQELGGTPIFGTQCSGNTESCCFADGTCQDLDPVCCQSQGGTPGGVGSACQGTQACCFGDGSCSDIDAECCLQQGGTPQGVGSDCTDPDICVGACEPDPNGPGCVGPCPDPTVEECVPRCVKIDPATGLVDATACDCIDPTQCHVVGIGGSGGASPSVVAGPTGNPCVVPDDFSGTVTLPPAGCDYLSPDEVHMIIDGLPAGTTIELGTIHQDFICRKQNAVCSFPLGVECDEPGGTLGGEKECASSSLDMQIQGTGDLSGFNRTLTVPVDFETHTGPRTPGDTIQTFSTDMFRLQGQLPAGDPDFCQLSITAGTDFGLPSPGHTTLTQLPSGDWHVDSFFDIAYRIEFQGCPGSQLDGLSGSTTGTIRMSTGAGGVQCEGDCPPGTECVETRTVNADGTVDVCCDCVEPTCEPSADLTDCVGSCPIPGDVCAPECVVVDPLTGELTVSGCDCYGEDQCHVDLANSAAGNVAVAGGGGNPCVVPDNGQGTIELPPPGCEYLSPEEVHEIVDGLPAGSTIELAAIHKDFICNKQDPSCAPPFVCDAPGGTLDGKIECFNSDLQLQMTGTGGLAGFNRLITLPVSCQTHTSPIPKEQAEQTFQNDMYSLQGEIVGDPDFDLLRITAGTAFGMPSPGQTTLTRLGPPGSSFAVDSFFDIEYRIDYVGAPGSVLDGLSGSNTGTLRMSTGGQPQCVGSCPPGEVCVREKVVQADGTIQLCCRCEPEVCEPTPDGLACSNIVCPVAGEECVPQQIKCTSNGCRVTVCDCQSPNECHVEMPLPGTTTPVCVGGCPLSNQRCVHFRKDLDGDGLAQEHFCRCIKKLPPIDIDVTALHNRFLSIQLGGPLSAREGAGRQDKSVDGSSHTKGVRELRGGDSAAIRIKVDNAPQFPGATGNVYWFGVPDEVCDDSSQAMPPPACSFGSFTSAELQCDPLFMDWTSVTALSIRGPDIVPGPSTYVVQWVDSSCEDLSVEDCYSDPVFLDTRLWGDVVPNFGGPSQPNFADIAALVDRFKDLASAESKADTDLGGHRLDLKVNFADITLDVDAFKGFPYPFSGPCACPSTSTCPALDACGRCTMP